MKILFTLISSDIRQIFRDKTLTVFLLAPVLLIGLVRFFIPYVTTLYPELVDYHVYIMMIAGIQTAIMFGFVVSFIILEEKDENVLQVIRVLPISTFYFIVYRLLFACFFSSLGAFLMIHLSGISYLGMINSVYLSIQYGLTAPFITLIVATYANNKIEGMAFFKGVDLILLLPIIYFFIEGNIQYIFSILPTFWTYLLYYKSMNQETTSGFFVAGLGVYGLIILILFLQFKKRIFDR